MTIIEISDIIENTFASVPKVNQSEFGDAYNVLDKSQVRYPIISYAPMNLESTENLDTWTFRIYSAERLTDSKKNTLFNYAELVQIIKTGLVMLNNHPKIVEVIYPIRYSFANQKFMDVNTVVYADVQIVTINDTPLC
jgi:hypothetical protein